MDEDNKRDDIDAEIEKVFQAGNRKDDPATKLSIDRLKAQIQAGRISPAAVRDILADDVKVSILIEKTRDDLEQIRGSPRATPTPASVPPSPIDNTLASALLAGQAEMRAELAEMRAVITELKAAAHTTIAATVELKAVSDAMNLDLAKTLKEAAAVNQKMRLRPTIQTAAITALFLAPVSVLISHYGEKALGFVGTWHWGHSQQAAPSLPPPTVARNGKQYWVATSPQDNAPPTPRRNDEPLQIPNAALTPDAPRPTQDRGGKARAAPGKAPG